MDHAAFYLPLNWRGWDMVIKAIDRVFKALADPSRRELLDRLHVKNGQTLSELCKGLRMARQSVTQHLGLLEGANLISVQRQGREKLHYFNPVPIHEIYERWIRKFEQGRLDALRDFKTKLERKGK
jgi:DNA-binding transcriptional ArsR family regulator